MDKLNCFPSNKNEALALLYLQNQDLSDMTPEEVNALYKETYERICKCDDNWTV